MGGGQKWAPTRGIVETTGVRLAARDGHHTCHWVINIEMPSFLVDTGKRVERYNLDLRPDLYKLVMDSDRVVTGGLYVVEMRSPGLRSTGEDDWGIISSRKIRLTESRIPISSSPVPGKMLY